MESGDRGAHGWVCHAGTFLIPYTHLKDSPSATGHSNCREHLGPQKESKHKENAETEASWRPVAHMSSEAFDLLSHYTLYHTDTILFSRRGF